MPTSRYMNLTEIENLTCEIAAEVLHIPREKISRTSRMIEDLHCDSLELTVEAGSVPRNFVAVHTDEGVRRTHAGGAWDFDASVM